jgi:hypothetical protein
MPEEMDQFQVLEEKVDSLLKYIKSLKKENESLAEKTQIQEEKLSKQPGLRPSRGSFRCWRELNKWVFNARERKI